MKIIPKDSVKRVKALLANQPVFPIPRGEIWLGTDLLNQAGFEDTVENHFHLAGQLDQDLVCLPITDGETEKPRLGYLYFQVTALKQMVQGSNRFIAAVVDGPFQEIVNQMGLMTVLTEWFQDRQKILKAYEISKTRVLALISKCLAQGIHAVVITDDLATDHGPFMSPLDIGTLSTPFYGQAVQDIHGAGCYAFLHSCGKLERLVPLFGSWNMDGLAAIQHSVNTLWDLKKAMGGIIMGGIDGELLETEMPSPVLLSEFQAILNFGASHGGLILSSSTGLYKGEFLEPIKKIYRMADGPFPGPR